MRSPLAALILAGLVAFGSGLGVGWKVANWAYDSNQLLINQAATAAGNHIIAGMQRISSNAGRELEHKLEGLKSAMPQAIRSEMAKGVFNAVCFSDDFVRMYNDASTRAERALSGKPENHLPDYLTTPHQ